MLSGLAVLQPLLRLRDQPDGQITSFAARRAVKSLSKKYSGFPKWQIRSISAAVPSHSEGRFAIVTNAGRDAVDANHATDESVRLRTAKSCGPDAPMLASSSWEAGFSGVRVAKKPVARESAK
jgi:hypothetical protein